MLTISQSPILSERCKDSRPQNGRIARLTPSPTSAIMKIKNLGLHENHYLTSGNESSRSGASAALDLLDSSDLLALRTRHLRKIVNPTVEFEPEEGDLSKVAVYKRARLLRAYDEMICRGEGGLDIRKSNIHGLGVFTNKLFGKNDFLAEYTGDAVSHTELKERRRSYREYMIRMSFFFHLDENTVIDSMLCQENKIAKRINHSCTPNCHALVKTIDGRKTILIVASKSIQIGQEVTIDYKFQPLNLKEPEVACKCKTDGCRKFIDKIPDCLRII